MIFVVALAQLEVSVCYRIDTDPVGHMKLNYEK